MRRTWFLVVLAATAGGCGLVSGLDQLSVEDASTGDEPVCGACDGGSFDQSAGDVADDASADVIASGEASTPDGGLTIRCGNAVCSHGVCCRSGDAGVNNGGFSYACVDSAQSCKGTSFPCDSENDCPSGQVCCAEIGSGGCAKPTISCMSAQACQFGAFGEELCSPNDKTCSDNTTSCETDFCVTGFSSCQ